MQQSDMTLHGTPTLRSTRASAPVVRTMDRAIATPWAATVGLASVYLLLAYEWLVSGLNKVMSAGFQSGLAKNLKDAIDGNPNHWYVRFLDSVAIPHPALMAFLVQWGEIAVGLGLVLGALRWLASDRLSDRLVRWLDVALIGALAGAALMTVNYWLMSGNTLPWLNARNPFNEGIDIDGLLTLVSVALLVTQVRAMHAARAVANR